ncbi:MAG: hypothetical protein L0323_16940 [Planctomycetes bacterium]|nr:hypothetical protein [Planctomycetota bacterium]
MRAFLLLASAVLLLAGEALGDVVRLKNGGRLEGKVVSQNDTEVVIETSVGRQTIPRADVEAVEIGATPRDEYLERLKKVDKRDLMELADLVDFCKTNNLRKEMKDVYSMILRIDADNEEAREGLGYVKIEGEWVSKARAKELEAERKRKEEEESKRPSKEPAKGKAAGPAPLEVGAAITANAAADKAEADSLKDYFGGTPPTVLSSRNFSIKGQVPPDRAQELLDLLEKAYAELNAKFGLPPEHQMFKAGVAKRLHFLFLNDKATFNDLLPWVESKYHKLDDAARDFVRESCRMAPSVTGTMAALVQGDGGLEGDCLHNLGGLYVDAMVGAARPWLQEGFSFFVSTSHIGRNTTYCTTLTEYGKGSIADKDLDNSYVLLCREMVEEKTFRPFRELMVTGLNKLDYEDLAQGWSIVRYILEGHPDTFLKFFKSYNPQNQEKTLKDVFGVSPEEFDAGWCEWVLKNLQVAEKKEEKGKGKKGKEEPKKPPPKKKGA